MQKDLCMKFKIFALIPLLSIHFISFCSQEKIRLNIELIKLDNSVTKKSAEQQSKSKFLENISSHKKEETNCDDDTLEEIDLK